MFSIAKLLVEEEKGNGFHSEIYASYPCPASTAESLRPFGIKIKFCITLFFGIVIVEKLKTEESQ